MDFATCHGGNCALTWGRKWPLPASKISQISRSRGISSHRRMIRGPAINGLTDPSVIPTGIRATVPSPDSIRRANRETRMHLQMLELTKCLNFKSSPPRLQVCSHKTVHRPSRRQAPQPVRPQPLNLRPQPRSPFSPSHRKLLPRRPLLRQALRRRRLPLTVRRQARQARSRHSTACYKDSV